MGTSITQSAVKMLASAGVLIDFSGGGGTPQIMALNHETAITLNIWFARKDASVVVFVTANKSL